MVSKENVTLLDNSRFYILGFSLLISLVVFAWLRLLIPADQLYYIRVQQVFGLLCIVYWYCALLISPLGYFVGKNRIKRLEYARRAIGVSAFYFALLHGIVALWGQLGGLTQVQYLPELFKWSLAGGGVALLVLGVMALTSFDKVVRYMTFRRWKSLHRFVYGGGILAIVHIWSVGTHLAYTGVQLAAFIGLVVLVGLEMYRIAVNANKKYLHLDHPETIALFIAGWAVMSALIFMIPLVVENYHSRHSDHASQSHEEAS